ncbi:hypothetical protein [Streptomyces sp. JJ36]|uniref:hypothetical protein n=1 Tax=Streptomyces sp. JJ36 TaxID=2736645 RepID=UPI001F204CDF|nr:hypothetical protein [Streptomyces sp. JJ36]MCF6523781.1 hypothetical protein [Streptomyces sp. JJ36]
MRPPTGAPPAPSVVPYITAHQREPHVSPPVVRRYGWGGQGLGYRNETPYDRDADGALWVRQAIVPRDRRGEPQFETVHALRQRRAMLDLLCQVCGKHTIPEDEGRHLFLLRDVGRPVAEGERTTAPPLCVPCAGTAVEECPPLRRGHVAVRVQHAPAWGVAGVLHDPETLERIPGRELEEVSYGSPLLRWVLAARMVVSLHGCVPVDLDAELAG